MPNVAWCVRRTECHIGAFGLGQREDMRQIGTWTTGVVGTYGVSGSVGTTVKRHLSTPPPMISAYRRAPSALANRTCWPFVKWVILTATLPPQNVGPARGASPSGAGPHSRTHVRCGAPGDPPTKG